MHFKKGERISLSRHIQQNSITCAEKTAQINPFNLQLKQDFLDYLKSVQRSPKTIAGYDNDLLIVFTYILDYLGNKKFTELTKREIVGLQNWLINENGNSPARVRRIKSAISSLSNYICNVLDDEPEFKDYRSIVRKIEDPVLQPVNEKTVWSDEDLESLLAQLTEQHETKKACVLALAMYSGRRKAELCRFRMCDFTEANLVLGGAFYKTSEPLKTKGFGLGKYIYCYTLAKKFQPYLDAWVSEREENGIDSQWLFPADDDQGQQISESTLNSWARSFSRMTGKDFYWHSLRHYFTTSMVRAGIPDNVVTQIVGWSSSDMCALYTDLDVDEQIGMYFTSDGEFGTSPKGGISSL
jgi:integrase